MTRELDRPVVRIGTVSGLWRYPASSLAGESLTAASVAADGLAGDRLYGLVEAATGRIAAPDGADPRWTTAPAIRTRLTGRQLDVAVPGRPWIEAPSAAASEALSGFMGFGVEIRALAEAAPAGFEGPTTTGRYRKAPVHLLTTASLAELKRLHPAGQAEPQRFRPNILVAMDAVEGAFPEAGWIGRRLRIGPLVLSVVEPCRRCGFTVIEQPGVGNDPEILRQLVRHNGRNMGVYCTVDAEASIAQGESVELL